MQSGKTVVHRNDKRKKKIPRTNGVCWVNLNTLSNIAGPLCYAYIYIYGTIGHQIIISLNIFNPHNFALLLAL